MKTVQVPVKTLREMLTRIRSLENEVSNLLKQTNTVIREPTVKTEDLGKMFEKAVCDYYEIPYNGT